MQIPKEGEWTFENTEIANAFDDHVRCQLPWYDLATGCAAHFIRHYLPENGVLYDIGASTGNITNIVRDTIKSRNAKAISIEPSKEMRDIWRGEGEVIDGKAENIDFEDFDVAVMFLTMMFIPVKERRTLLAKLVSRCNRGGCVIIFDKCVPQSGYVATVMGRLTLAGKVSTGTPSDEIIKKELSLSGCQRPYSIQHDNAIEIFRFADFAGWIIESNL